MLMAPGRSHGAAVAPGRGGPHRLARSDEACRAGAARAGMLIALTLTPIPGWGQISPNCQLNGRPLACAITPGPEGPPAANGLPTTSSLTVMYADGQAFRLVKQEARCQLRGPRSDCPATITPRNGFGSAVAATYRGLADEGGYRHEYNGGGIRIVYFFVD
jgi:hypothetical protein